MPRVKSTLPKEVQYLIDELYTSKDKVRSRKKLPKLALGHLALFYYPDPKTKNQMEVYDTLPLIIILWVDGQYCEGINIHWIPWSYRIKLMKNIMKHLETGKKLKYKDIKKAWNQAQIPLAYAQLAYRKYLINRIRSEFKIFGPDNWKPVTTNVLGNFKKQNASKVMKDINKKMRDQKKGK